jgi:hypothetical protein
MTGADEDAGGATPSEEPRPEVEADGSASTPKRQHFARTIDILAVIILSVATVSSAWSAYEATRWSGVQAVNYSQASAMRTESTRQSNRADTLTAIDIQLFSDWVAAVSQKDARRADFLRARFREEFRPAFEAWLGSVPKGTIPAGTPFTLPEYSLAARHESDRLVAEAEVHFAAANDANQTGDNFVLTTVLFATVLFFAGIASHFESVGIKRTMLVLGMLMWVAAVGIMFSLPQNVGF